MATHSIFYYPYGDFRDKDLPLLKAAALYFDTLYILDPLEAVSGEEEFGRALSPHREQLVKDIELLEDEKILVRIHPKDVLAKYGAAIEAAIREDIKDPAYRTLCADSGLPQKWILALAKVPQELQREQELQQLMGDLPTSLIPELEGYYQQHTGQQRYEEINQVYTEHSILKIDYRFREFSLPVGESIMINHALFGSLLHTQATPFTDDPFHRDVLNHKIKRARSIPAIRQVIDDRIRERGLKADILAASAIVDEQLDLPTLTPELPMEVVLEYRRAHTDDLQAARRELALLGREIEDTPWSADFVKQVENTTIPKIIRELDECRKARDAWSKSSRGRLALDGTGVALASAAVALPLVVSATPLLPIAAVIAGLSVITGTVIPNIAGYRDWLGGKQAAVENGLHYFLDVKRR